MSSTQINRDGLLSMVKGGDGRTESYIEDIPSAQGGGAILHLFCNGKEGMKLYANRKTAELMLEIANSDL